MELPIDLLYYKEHIWVRREGSDLRIGITEFAQSELGDIVFVDLPEVGDTIERDEPFGNVESVKTVSELYAPLNGTVVEINDTLTDKPELVNESPYQIAWLIVVEADDDDQLDDLYTSDEYEAYISE